MAEFEFEAKRAMVEVHVAFERDWADVNHDVAQSAAHMKNWLETVVKSSSITEAHTRMSADWHADSSGSPQSWEHNVLFVFCLILFVLNNFRR